MTQETETQIIKVISTYSEAQKKATKKYRENNKEKINEQRKKYYQHRKETDPGFLPYKRQKAKEYYDRKKALKLQWQNTPTYGETDLKREDQIIHPEVQPERADEIEKEVEKVNNIPFQDEGQTNKEIEDAIVKIEEDLNISTKKKRASKKPKKKD